MMSKDTKRTISIHTDEEEKFKSVFKASLYNIGSQFFSSLMCIFVLYIQLIMGGIAFRSITRIEESEVPTEKVSLTFMDFGYKENDDTSPYISFDKSILAQRIFTGSSKSLSLGN